MTSKTTQNSSENENTCVVCFKNVDIYSIGDCDHPVCYECSTRMRVLCCQTECPICRNVMPEVIFTTQVVPFHRLKSRVIPSMQDKKFGIYFMNTDIHDEYWSLLEHICSKCNAEPFRSFYTLKEHMRKQHELFYCDLCSDNLKIFSFERRCYTRPQLAIHRRKGDPDNRSHKGHPLCEFCDTRYMDSDELYRHLRQQHLYCHFCDADGMHHYYSSYEYLRQHFQNEHFLCEEGNCKDEHLTSVFRTDIDLKAHKASIHGRQLGKAGSKQARTLELEFRLAPRPRPEQPPQGRGQRIPPPQTLGQHLGVSNEEWFEDEGAVGFETFCGDMGAPKQQALINAFDPELFPTLSGVQPPVLGSSSIKPLTRSNARGTGITIRHTGSPQGLARTNENFPALSSDAPTTSTVRLSVNSSGGSEVICGPTRSTICSTSAKAPNVSIHVNHKPKSGITTRVNQNTSSLSYTAPKHQPPVEAFPALSSNTPVQTAAQWINQKPKEPPKPKPTKVAPAPVLPSSKHFNHDFPSLTKTVESPSTTKKTEKSEKSVKKSNTPAAPVTNSWSSEESSKSSESKIKSKKKKPKNINASSKSTNSETKQIKKVTTTNNNTSGALDNNTNNNSCKKKSTPKPKLEQNGQSDSMLASSTANIVKRSVIQNDTVERKKSELKIGNLKTPSVPNKPDDFPRLSSVYKNPPGFGEQVPKKAPPGFTQPPPPGFNCVNSVVRSVNDLTFTNSSGQKFPILPANKPHIGSTVFYSPPNFSHRNKTLVASFMSALSGDDLNEFRQFSHFFKEGSYSAQSYYEHCRTALGKQFNNIFPELLVLLPDIQKQRELYAVHQKQTSDSISSLETCATCGQIVMAVDLKHHVANHTLENHFPVLGGNTANDVSTAWKKA